MPSLHLAALHLYPVKSCRGLSVSAATMDEHGLVGDRRFMVVNESDGLVLTQRTHPRMALIETTLTPDTLALSAPKTYAVTIPLAANCGLRRVTVWQSTVTADDCGDEPAEWLTDFLGLPLRLVRMGNVFQRPIVKPTARPGDVVSFADAYPCLVISEASLSELNQRLTLQNEPALPMDRFRPNLVVSGCTPFAEDAWTRIKIGDMIFRNAGPCARCLVTTTNQQTAKQGKEPLKTLATYRRDPAEPSAVNFGTNLIHETKHGQLRVGMGVETI